MPTLRMLAAVLTLSLTVCLAGEPKASAPAALPQYDGIVVDGQTSDWPAGGLGLLDLPANPFRPGAPGEGGPSARLAWNAKGLLFLFECSAANVEVDPKALWQGDSVEITANTLEADNRIKAILAPNSDPANRAPLMELHDLAKKGRTVQVEAVTVRPAAGGYVLEVLIPWTDFGVVADAATRVELDLRLNRSIPDSDRIKTTRWARRGPEALTLGREVPAAPTVRAGVRYAKDGQLDVCVLGALTSAGLPVRVLTDNKEVAQGKLEAQGPWAVFQAAIPDFGTAGETDRLAVVAGTGAAEGRIEVPRAEFYMGGPTGGADWPAYLADAARSGVTNERVPFPVAPAWTYTPPREPSPAWPEPGKENHRLDFDYAFQPVVADGMVYFGSSADDTVRALDLSNGSLKWRYTTGGPVRLAPAVAGGKLYVTSDDGCLYCLEAKTGALVWKVAGAPQERKLLGNRRLISRWPCRSGALVADGVVYFSAGMWPADGIYVYALDANTGKEIWRNDSSGSQYINQPHGGSSAFTGVTPQGHLFATADLLLVPSGRTTPAAYARRTGKLVWYQPYLYLPGYPDESWSNRSSGGSWLAVAGDVFFSPVHKPSAPDLPGKVGEAGPQPGDGVGVFSLKTGLREKVLLGKHRVLAAGDVAYVCGDDELAAVDLKKVVAGKADAPKLWSVKHPGRVYALALTRNALLVGEVDGVTAYRTTDGTKAGGVVLGEQVRGLAVSAGRLVVATPKGRIICLGAGRPEQAAPALTEAASWTLCAPGAPAVAAQEILRQTGVTRGYALVAGGADNRLAACLALQSELHVIRELPAGSDLARERQGLAASPLYGSRLAVERLLDLGSQGYPQYFANLVVVTGDAAKTSAKELYRVLRPCGGKLCFSGVAAVDIPHFLEAAGIPPEEVVGTGAAITVVRGKLAGAGEWRSQWADSGKSGIGTESRLRLPLELLWFGGPGPDRMMPRHWGTSPPLEVSGRTFVTGSDHVICFDSYNGLELWANPLTGVGRKMATWVAGNFTADDDSLYATVANLCYRLDQKTGRALAVYEVPDGAATKAPALGGPAAWGYLSVANDFILGTANLDEAGNATALFVVAKPDGAVRWTYPAQNGHIINRAVAHTGQTVYLLEAPRPKGKTKPKYPGDLVALDLARGTEKWRRSITVTNAYVACSDGVVLAGGCSAFDGESGQPLWSQAAKSEALLIHGGKVITVGDFKDAQPAFDLKTGAPWLVPEPVGGAQQPWHFIRAYGCGQTIGCQNLLFCRSGTAGVFDVSAQALTNFGGMRPNCSVSMIPGDGLVVLPEAASSCSCSYNFQTSLALVPAESAQDLWYVCSGEAPSGRVRNLRLNFGAPGDRRDQNGDFWLSCPRPVLPLAKPVRVDLTLKDAQPFHRRSLAAKLPADAPAWLYTNGISGQGSLVVQLTPKAAEAPAHPYTVRLHWAEPDELPAGARVFSVAIQGETRLKDLDLAKETGGACRPVVKEFKGVMAQATLTVELQPVGANPQHPPVLCGLEILAED